MSLGNNEKAEIILAHASGHQASDLIPFIKKLISENRLNDISNAINYFVQIAEFNKLQIRAYLIARVPGLLINFYWPSKLIPHNYDKLIRYTLENDFWSSKIKNAVDFGTDLIAVVTDIEKEADIREDRVS